MENFPEGEFSVASPSETRRGGECGEVWGGETRVLSHEGAADNRVTISVASVAPACTIAFDDGVLVARAIGG